MSQQVRFSFQGDVFAGGSLALSTAGRLLKALSDGNVDVLAVTAALHLGKDIQSRSSRNRLLLAQSKNAA